MNYKAGLIWRKWDLHVHTPCSIIQFYGGNTDEVWERYIQDLENLPAEYKVLGINDYLFLDGYKRVLNAKKKGRLSNIDLLLPIIEFRLDKFGGSRSKLSNVNFHVIFSDTIKPEVIEGQFINALAVDYTLTPKHKKLTGKFAGVVNKQSLIDLGEKIIESVPEDERANYSSPLIEGFNNLCFSYNHIMNLLSNSTYFKGKYLTAVGKTEWSDVKWGRQSIAEKKHIINDVDLVFISSFNYKKFEDSKKSLTKSGVNDLLLDCSDAHYYSNSKEKDRIGNSMTWIKSDPTFTGLKMLLVEPDERVYVGETPREIQNLENFPTRYIKSIKIKRTKSGKLKEKWFDTELTVNLGFVSIIGKKGNGKSALSDVIGLLGESRNEEHFSFLNDQKFRKKPANKASHFVGQLIWGSGQSTRKKLSDNVIDSELERVKYIPQEYFEKVCTELSDIDIKESDFYKEIKKVIFTHIDDAQRLNQSSLDDIIKTITSVTEESIGHIKTKISSVNSDITELEKKSTMSYKTSLESQLKQREAEVSAHRKRKPTKVSMPKIKGTSTLTKLNDLEKVKKEFASHIKEAEELKKGLVSKNTRLNKLIEKTELFHAKYQEFRNEFIGVIAELPIKFEDIFTFSINDRPLKDELANVKISIKKNERSLDPNYNRGPVYKLNKANKDIENIEKLMDERTRKYQKNLDDQEKWNRDLSDLEGDPETPDTLEFFKARIKELDEIPSKLEKLYNNRMGLSKNLHNEIGKLRSTLKKLNKGIEKFLDAHPNVLEVTNLNIDVSIVNVGFRDRIFDWLDKRKIGTIDGKSSEEAIAKIINSFDYNTVDGMIGFLKEVEVKILALNSDKEMITINEKLKKGRDIKSLYDFLYSLEYLIPNYVLRMGERELTQLSPGERGTLLLIFYLLLDRETKPLIIDQPEHNLDNETVYRLLVPAIKDAKKRRQIIIITHNPNLAVVSCSDQIICAKLDIEEQYRLDYESGSIENPIINKRIIDILEGTPPAFNKRRENYIPQEFADVFGQ